MEFLIALIALSAMEIVLGIDNIVFLAIVTSRLPIGQQPQARRLGLLLALVLRILLLLTLSIMLQLDQPLFDLSDIGFPKAAWIEAAQHDIADAEQAVAAADPHAANLRELEYEVVKRKEWLHTIDEFSGVSGKDLILLCGGLFLIWKSVHEIHAKFAKEHDSGGAAGSKVSFRGVLISIGLMDLVFSLDSVITAVGMVNAHGDSFWIGISVMVAAVVLAVCVMLAFAEPVSHFVESNPTLKVLALSFLLLIGVMLVAEGIGTHFNKGYIYFAMAFALLVEMLNLRIKHVTTQLEPA